MNFRRFNNCFGGLFGMFKIDNRNVRFQFDRGEFIFHLWEFNHYKKLGDICDK